MTTQGTPLLLAGDEFGNSQSGNNNAYCQDNDIGWLDWDTADAEFTAFCQKVIAFRKAHPILRQKRFLHSRARLVDGEPDLFWRRADGSPMTQADWDNPDLQAIVAEMRMASGTPEYVEREGALLVVLNAGPAFDLVLPELPEGGTWARRLDTSETDAVGTFDGTRITDHSVVVFEQLRPKKRT